MRPVDMQVVGEELAIKWQDGTEHFLRLDFLRRHCPCAGCQGEKDVMGRLYKAPDRPLSPAAFQLNRLQPVGNYAVTLFWADGHNTGIYSYEYLRRLGETAGQ